MERKLSFAVGEFYHVYNRGVEKRNIFLDINDRERFLRLLHVANSTNPFKFRDIENKPYELIDRGDLQLAIGAYCLMPNHFHILVKEVVEGGISRFMEKMTTSYSMYFNKRHARVGPLFQGRFKAQQITHDRHLKYLFSYIHLNPIKMLLPSWQEKGFSSHHRAAKRYLDSYRHSSYLDYIGFDRAESAILEKAEFPEYFAQSHDFADFVEDWLELKSEANG